MKCKELQKKNELLKKKIKSITVDYTTEGSTNEIFNIIL